jgi:hypothetical protein
MKKKEKRKDDYLSAGMYMALRELEGFFAAIKSYDEKCTKSEVQDSNDGHK